MKACGSSQRRKAGWDINFIPPLGLAAHYKRLSMMQALIEARKDLDINSKVSSASKRVIVASLTRCVVHRERRR